MPPLSPVQFATKWQGSVRTERAASQEHFIDLCRMLGVKTPNEADPTGDFYAFEKGAEKTGGGDGFADVWNRATSRGSTRASARTSRRRTRSSCSTAKRSKNPPLLVVCDLDRFEIHTNFTNTPKEVHGFTLGDLLEGPKEPLRVLRAVMSAPEELKPGKTREELTAEAAQQFAALAFRLARQGPRAAGRRALPQQAAVLHVRRGRRLAAERLDRTAHGRWSGRSGTLHVGARGLVREDVQGGRTLRRRAHPVVQRRTVRWTGSSADDADRRSTSSRTSHASTGPRSSRRSSGRCSSAGLTPASARSSALTTPTASRSSASWSRCSWLRCGASSSDEDAGRDASRREKARHVAHARRPEPEGVHSRRSSTGFAPCAFSILRAARATSSTWPCSSSRTLSARRSFGAR